MEKKWKVLITFAVVIVLVAGLYSFTNWFSIVTGYFKGEDASTRLTSCLNNKDTEFYFSFDCVDCEKQEREFGRGFSGIRKIDCGLGKIDCPNVREVPAWYINGEVYYGFKSVEELNVLGGCV